MSASVTVSVVNVTELFCNFCILVYRPSPSKV